MNSALMQYRKVGINSGVQDADPHRLVQMLFQGAVDGLNVAQGQLRNGDVPAKVASITRVINILWGLREGLNFDAGDVAQNLDALYDYMIERLAHANAHNDEAALEEVRSLLMPIKGAWDEIRGELPPEMTAPRTSPL
jgi:flagellar protein FliS